MLKNHLNITLTTMTKVRIGCESINLKKKPKIIQVLWKNKLKKLGVCGYWKIITLAQHWWLHSLIGKRLCIKWIKILSQT